MRSFAAEGVLQGHKVFVVLGGGAGAAGWGERWGRELPGLAAGASQTQAGKQEWDDGGGDGDGVEIKKEAAGGDKREKMKIAWRYERLGEFGGGGGGLAAGSRGTKHVSFPDLSFLVHSEIPKNPKIIPDRASFANCAVFMCAKRANRRPKPPQRQIELCRRLLQRFKLVHHPPRHP